MSLSREQQFAEHLANGLDLETIAQRMGYSSLQSARAQFQRIRAKLGWQAQ